MPMPLHRSKKGKMGYSRKGGKGHYMQRWDPMTDMPRKSKTIVLDPELIHTGDLPEKEIVSGKGMSLLLKRFKGKRIMLECPECGSKWKAKVVNPQRCPRCKKRLGNRAQKYYI